MQPAKKRKAAAPQLAPTSSSKTTTRRSKLAKENDITAEEEAEIKSAWALFSIDDADGYEDEKEGVIQTESVQKALVSVLSLL